MNALWQTFRSIGMADILDMAVVSIFIYSLFRLFEWTKAAAVARGIFILGVLYVVARYLGMVLTTWIFHGFFAVFIIALVIIFQEELRRFFERLAVWSARPQAQPFQTNTVDIIVRCVSQCAHERTGALIVLRGRDPLNRHMEGGFDLDGKLSAALLLSIFDIHSEGHDGAVLIDGGRVQKFGLHLPLSKNLPLLAGLGTRHAAAVGITEMTDAMCIVVSEQRGTIGVARRG
ncbi:MAG TPA: diadenylate cyclase, partial [Elusimicrobiota bacterium]|nr:diadenylate cyclase [Elusimicrobiota bacterium]